MTSGGFCIHKSIKQMNIYSPDFDVKTSTLCARQRQKIQEKVTKKIIIKPQKINQENFSKYGQLMNSTIKQKLQNYEEITSSRVSNIFGCLVPNESQSAGCPNFTFNIVKMKQEKFVDFDGTIYSDKNSSCLYFDRLISYDFNELYLGCVQKGNWYIGVGKTQDQFFPNPLDVEVFQLNHQQFIKLDQGVWHSKPLFLNKKYQDFYILVKSQSNFKKSHVYLIDPNPTLFNIQI